MDIGQMWVACVIVVYKHTKSSQVVSNSWKESPGLFVFCDMLTIIHLLKNTFIFKSVSHLLKYL